MLIFKLAYRNLIGAGLRTWLNAFVLSLAYVIIIWHSGILAGWNRQAKRDMINWQIGGGEIWNQAYDPYDPFTFQDAHGTIPAEFKARWKDGQVTPILVVPGSFYPEGRMQSVVMKGIDPHQSILRLPADSLRSDEEEVIPVMVGTRMARNNRLEKGDYVTLRWRDAHGTFDAAEARIVYIFRCTVPVVDNGIMWIPLEKLQQMTQMTDEATYFIIKPGSEPAEAAGWIHRGYDYLLAEMDQIIRQKSIGGAVLYTIMLALAMLAIFDTQVFSIFRRQREIGTEIAMGMTRGQVIGLFTAEGAMHGILAAILAAIYGIPLLSLQAIRGMALPEGMDEYGLAGSEKIFPTYSAGLVILTVLLVMCTTTIVSYWPSRKIARMKPTDAIRGKLQ
jgi:putative ABC transport system permease protein